MWPDRRAIRRLDLTRSSGGEPARQTELSPTHAHAHTRRSGQIEALRFGQIVGRRSNPVWPDRRAAGLSAVLGPSSGGSPVDWKMARGQPKDSRESCQKQAVKNPYFLPPPLATLPTVSRLSQGPSSGSSPVDWKMARGQPKDSWESCQEQAVTNPDFLPPLFATLPTVSRLSWGRLPVALRLIGRWPEDNRKTAGRVAKNRR